MGNRNTALFQSLKELPTPLHQSQCILHKHELLICGGRNERACYSYHTLKNEYKFICEYPSKVKLFGHCVVKLLDSNKDSNETTLLSFGGYYDHTLIMKYVSVWSDDNNNENDDNETNKLNKLKNYNQWIPFTDNNNNPIHIRNVNYNGVRAVIGGSNNHLLFTTYHKKNISVFNLNTFKFIKHDTLPTNNEIFHPCFVLNSENGQGQEMMNTNQEKNKNEMLLFHKGTGLLIKYDEDRNIFQFHQLPVYKSNTPFIAYGCVCINDIILFFGGWNCPNALKSVHKYSIRENKWTTFENTLPNPLHHCVAILNEEDNHIHIIGGLNEKSNEVSTHIKTKARLWGSSLLVMICFFLKDDIKFIIQNWVRTLKIKLGWIDDFDQIIFKYSRIK
ncbi:hypothetical protein RFI_23990 [Reticulomyxa filosa]|uniref:Kelch domain-containing protein n=1 Tax=Reticulomyxa filosa TaxID=46433 RepID=X6MK26_RETFI|nr:hypothetical protein RFI_23990 [Reticulomyxa filosa]|eukprot:ETO13385.1 hypothetical protein RFI_23990 [Reticulomyxa filosa]